MSQVLQCTQFEGFRLMCLPLAASRRPPSRTRWPGRSSGRTAEFLHAAGVADVGVVDDQVRGLVFLVLGAGVIEVGELVEGQLAVAFGGTEQMRFGAAVGGQVGELASWLVPGVSRDSVAQAASAGDLLQAGVEHARATSRARIPDGSCALSTVPA